MQTSIAPDLNLRSSVDRTGSTLERTWSVGEFSATTTVESDKSSAGPLGDWWSAFLGGAVPSVKHATTRQNISTVDLFCGPGGLSLGMRQAITELGSTWTPLAAVDHDPTAVEVYRRNHHPELTSTSSVSELVDYRVAGAGADARFRYEPELLEDDWFPFAGETDVLLAGPPCQGHSNLNNHSRRSDPRNELYLTVPAMAVALGAKSVVIENVPGVVHDSTGVVDSARALLQQSGYEVTEGVLKADRLGWPQTRSRFFMVASRVGMPLAIESIADSLQNEALSAMWAIGDLADVPSDDHMFRRPGLSDENLRRIDWLFDHDVYDLPLAERPECHQDGTSYMSVYGRMLPDRPAQTLTTGFLTPGRGRFVHPTRRRVLTPAEAARLQGFPSTYLFQPDRREIPSAASLTKWIGDAVPMPLGQVASLAALAPLLTDTSIGSAPD